MLSDTHEYNEYWKLNDCSGIKKPDLFDLLRQQGRTVSRYWNKGPLVEKQRLNYRRLLPYEIESINTEELKKFIHDRGLQVTHEAPDRAVFVEILERADREWNFSRFTDLPPELRERIYAMYMDEFPKKLTFPNQPPLTLTCRLLRREALPLFYRSTCFSLFFCYEMKRVPGKRGGLRPCLETALFLKSLNHGLTKIEFNIG